MPISAVYRWINPGLRGVQLEIVKIGGTTYTRYEALQRFGERLSQATKPPVTGGQRSSARQKQIDKAEGQVGWILGRPRPKKRRG